MILNDTFKKPRNLTKLSEFKLFDIFLPAAQEQVEKILKLCH